MNYHNKTNNINDFKLTKRILRKTQGFSRILQKTLRKTQGFFKKIKSTKKY